MCLITYSPNGELMPRDAFDHAHSINRDGIGVMSALGIEKFLGKKSRKRAWRYLSSLATEKIPYGIHFRWATHGDVVKWLCHPFKTPDGHYVMHNGVINQTAAISDEMNIKAKYDYTSDTSIFASYYLTGVPGHDAANYKEYFDKVEDYIGFGNKLLVFHTDSQKFTICNADAGEWIKGFWYSNTYSLPSHMMPKIYYTYRGTQSSLDWRDHASSAVNATNLATYYREREKENASSFYDEGYGTDEIVDIADCGACGHVHSRMFQCGGEHKELELEPTQEDEDIAEANAIAYLNGALPPNASDRVWQRSVREANERLNEPHPAVVAPTVIPATTVKNKLLNFEFREHFKTLVRAKAINR